MEQRHHDFSEKLRRFRAEVQLSATSTAKLLDVSPGTMSKWFTENPENGARRLPADYIMDAVELKIDRINSADRTRGVYSQLRGLKPTERVAFLQQVLDTSCDV